MTCKQCIHFFAMWDENGICQRFLANTTTDNSCPNGVERQALAKEVAEKATNSPTGRVKSPKPTVSTPAATKPKKRGRKTPTAVGMPKVPNLDIPKNAHGNTRVLTQDEYDYIVESRGKLSNKEIAAHLGITAKTLWKLLHRYNIPLYATDTRYGSEYQKQKLQGYYQRNRKK